MYFNIILYFTTPCPNSSLVIVTIIILIKINVQWHSRNTMHEICLLIGELANRGKELALINFNLCYFRTVNKIRVVMKLWLPTNVESNIIYRGI